MTDITVTQLNLLLDQTPYDWEVRLALADRYEELDEFNLAKYQRWAFKHKKVPENCSCTYAPILWCWWCCTLCHKNRPIESYLAHSFYPKIRVASSLPNSPFTTRQMMEDNLRLILEETNYEVVLPFKYKPKRSGLQSCKKI